MREKKNLFYDKVLSKLFTMMGFSGTFALMGCPVAYGPAPEDYNIVVNPDHLYFDNYMDKTQAVNVRTDGVWFISEVAPFISATPARGSYSSTITVRMVEENSQSTSRQGIIVVTSFEESKCSDTVYVYQAGKDDYGYWNY